MIIPIRSKKNKRRPISLGRLFVADIISHRISAFIRDAILDEKLTMEISQDPVKYDYSHSIRQLITAIPTLDKRWIRCKR